MKLTASDSVNSDLEGLVGKKSILKYLLNGSIEIEILLAEGWNANDLSNVIKHSFVEPPFEMHIISIVRDVSMLN
tara:strand:+ start:25 stop:249 length:225 start_codon:yes stop_codon:yes gene_type:complete